MHPRTPQQVPDDVAAAGPRRWFQVRLSTVLMLTAIAAGGMATWPWYQERGGCIRSTFDEWNVWAFLPATALVSFVAWKGATIPRMTLASVVVWLTWMACIFLVTAVIVLS
ncbi:MAG: hypothetical protein K2Y37_18185 [Pirellulales bacterium]|nr:hypothetical protein [Pirellulales bacterium]